MIEWPIDELIPQKYPFVFVDEVVSFNETEISTRFEVKSNAILVSEGKLQEAALIENMAQTAAALEGCNAKLRNSEVKVGFIGSVKNLEIIKVAKVGQILETKLKIITNVLGVNIAEGKVFVNDELIAHCTINIFLKEE